MKIIFYSLLIILTFTISCNAHTDMKFDTYFKQMRLVAESTRNSPTWSDFFSFNEFTEKFLSPNLFIEHAKRLLAHPAANENQQIVVCYSMQKLELDRYVSFLSFIVELRSEGKITPKVLENACFPSYEWNTQLAENYDDERIRHLITKIRMLPELSRYALQRINLVESGEAKKHVVELRFAGQLP